MMKKMIPFTVLAFLLGLSFEASAKSGYTGPSPSPITVAEAKKLKDDAPVVLMGKIEKSLGGEKYTFRDATDSVTVEIDDEDWAGIIVGPNDLVEIHGEVDKSFSSFEIDVDKVVKKQVN